MKKVLCTISNVKLIIGNVLLFLFFSIYLFPKHEGNLAKVANEKVKILDLRFGYTQADVQQLFDTLTPEGLEIYYNISSVFDSLYPFVYGILLILLLAFVIKKSFSSNSNLLYVSLSPISIIIIDFFENWSIQNLIQTYQKTNQVPVGLVQYSSMLNQTKWSIVILILVLLVSLIGYRSYSLNKN